MWRDLDSRRDEREERDRLELSRGARAGSDSGRTPAPDADRDDFSRDLNLPRGRVRERVHVRDREYDLRGSEVRLLATVGTFRVIPVADLRRPAHERPHVARKDLLRLRELGLIQTVPYADGRTRTTLVTLTARGRSVLEGARRAHEGEASQTFYAGVAKPRELGHDARLYRAYLQVADRLRTRGAAVRRVVLDDEMKRDYQRFLQAPNRGRRDSTGRPDRDAEEIARWAEAYRLPVVDEHVVFPDVRIEYENADGRRAIEDLELITPHYRARLTLIERSGFTRCRVGTRLGGLAEEVLT